MTPIFNNRNKRAPTTRGSGVSIGGTSDPGQDHRAGRYRGRSARRLAGRAPRRGLGAGAVTPPPAHLNNTVGLKTVGPIDETNGFPLWYKDTSGQRLELCLDPDRPELRHGRPAHTRRTDGLPDQLPGRGLLVDGRCGARDQRHRRQGAVRHRPRGSLRVRRRPARCWPAELVRSHPHPRRRRHRRCDLQGHPPVRRRHDRRRARQRQPRRCVTRHQRHRRHRRPGRRQRLHRSARQPPGSVPEVGRHQHRPRRPATSAIRPSTTRSPAARTTPTSSASKARSARSPVRPTSAPTRHSATAPARPTSATASRPTSSR